MALDYFIHKPQAVCQDRRLTPCEQDFLCLIAGLIKAGGCTASNQYFADFFGVSRPRAVKIISGLKRKKFIETEIKKIGGWNTERIIKIIDAGSNKSLLSDPEIGSNKLLPRSNKTYAEVVTNPTPLYKEDNISDNISSWSKFSFVLKTGENWNLPEEKLQQYQQTYKGVDVETEMRKAAQWLVDNPSRRKTAKGMPRFLSGWLLRKKPAEPSPLDNNIDEAKGDEFMRVVYGDEYKGDEK